MPYQTPQELAAIRPVDIIDQDMFDDMLASIPRPVPSEWRDQFNRLGTIARRHGFLWPYMRRTHRKAKRAAEQSSVPARVFPRAGLADCVPAADAAPDLPPGFSFAKPEGQSFGHVAFRDGWEYFHGDDTYLYRARADAPFDPEGYRTPRELVGRHGGYDPR